MYYDYHSCKNCQYLLQTPNGAVCNAFHILGVHKDPHLDQENFCPDFDPVDSYSRFIECKKPTQKQLESLSDNQVNIFNESVGSQFTITSMTVSNTSSSFHFLELDPTHNGRKYTSQSVSLELKASKPTLLLRPNGQCPIKIKDNDSGLEELVYIKAKGGLEYSKTYYFCTDVFDLDLELEGEELTVLYATHTKMEWVE
jgi:hypothetical protein